MKNLNPLIIAACVITLFASSCKKDSIITPFKSIHLSLSTVMINQPLTVLSVVDSSHAALFTVSPSGSNTVKISGHQSFISFSKPGTYVIQGAAAGSLPVSLTVTNQTYQTTTTNAPLTGDQIVMTPHVIDTGGVISVYFIATTVNSYSANNATLVAAQSWNQGAYNLNFSSILIPATANASVTAGPVSTRLTMLNSLKAGTYPISCQLNGATYSGSAVLTSKSVIFNWNYTSGVTIIPNHLNF